ncbi:MAG: helix-turn-helix transcriptional regulator [Oscillospiraceae bacterium]|jgi:DNA-binding Xre family transcriptional regulator|nr:helix-turn-helix transcriptional regulator [Oscillospiraceae bacterium]
MRFEQRLREKGISRYQLSKNSGVPWATLADIYSGKTHWERCSAATLLKLAKALDMAPEELVLLDNQANPCAADGKPVDKTYLEADLPARIQKAIADYLQGEKDQVLHLDCLSDELYGAINANLWSGCITEEQAGYLRRKYLYGTEADADD